MPRYFTLLEAEQTLPHIEELLRKLTQLRQDHVQADGEMSAYVQRITSSGGMMVSHDRLKGMHTRKESTAQSFNEIVTSIQSTGCILKDIDQGLIDFPVLYRDEEVYLCWKLGEQSIQFWHRIEDGFRGRQPLDSEFLSNMRSDLHH